VVQVPILAFLGLLSVSSIFVTVILTHEIGRIAGPAWIILCLLYYAWHRRRNHLPVFGSVKHDWEQEQVEVLTNAEEFESLEEYKQALVTRDKQLGARSRWSEP
jgi:APA family basic amino acid/polyamine antiporter